MANYLAQRIIDKAQDYSYVISKRPDLKEGIDKYLNNMDSGELIIT
ncbi:hypothetical protein [Paenibacillus macquariensis]|uniref:Uncharacterized protein n=1 Tax=Paenibacillus macquariensis TaxID=948756 RepID=A0ABY1JXI7_9BACL|nr:hypothetical protein [Paenibacillus macquariensis]MEC0089317.1 hypothetical protein [Paenibacillus macquariensis]SIQ93936.1 hypothetical protein SAMN05421578_105141 [Paenibacillus macquariensis]